MLVSHNKVYHTTKFKLSVALKFTQTGGRKYAPRFNWFLHCSQWPWPL